MRDKREKFSHAKAQNHKNFFLYGFAPLREIFLSGGAAGVEEAKHDDGGGLLAATGRFEGDANGR